MGRTEGHARLGRVLARPEGHADASSRSPLRSPATAGVTLGYLISRSHYLIRVFEPLLAGIYSVPIILFLPLYVLFFGLGPGSKIAHRHHHQLLPDRAQHHRGLWLRRPHLHHRGALDGRVRRADVPLCAAAGGAPGDPDRPAHRLHRGAAVDPRQRDHRVARRPRPQDRASRGGDGDGADVRLHRVCGGDRGDAQHLHVSALERRAKRR